MSKLNMTQEAQFRRESENRTFSERQLDKFILRQEKQKNISEKQNLEDEIQKRIQTNKTFSFGKNQLQQENQKNQENKVSENQSQNLQEESQKQQQTQQQQNSNGQGISLKDAFQKVCKNLGHENKYQKALQTLQQLVIKHIHHASLLQRFDILLQIFQTRHKYARREDLKKIALDIYKMITKNDKFNQMYSNQLETLSIYFLNLIQLQNDDSFTFSQIINKQIQPIIDNLEQDKQNINVNLPDPVEQHKAEVKEQKEELKQEQKNVVLSIRDKLKKNKQENKEEVQKQENEQKLENEHKLIQEPEIPEYEYECQAQNSENYLKNDKKFLFSIKQHIVIEIMEFLVDFYKNKWSRSSINQILSDIYYNKKFLFDEDLHEKMDVVAEQWIDLKNQQTSHDFRRSQLDGNILGIGNSKNEVSDSRATRLILDNGANTWGNKQR